MNQANASLIQFYSNFLSELRPQFDTVVRKYQKKGLTELSFVRWIIIEELELVYGLFEAGQVHRIISFEKEYNELKMMLPFRLSQCFSHYIKAPKIYPDNNLVNVIMLPNGSFSICYSTNLNKFDHQHDR